VTLQSDRKKNRKDIMALYGLIKALHVLAIAAVIAGIVGRGLIRTRLIRIDDIRVAGELVSIEGQFDEWLVARGSMATLVTGLLLTWLGHWPLVNAGGPTWTLVGSVLFLATIPLVIWVYLPRGKVFGTAYQAALAQKRVTAELRAALSDEVIRLCYLYEYLMFPSVVALMVLKPF
jgi:uncharacterized membrane protein